MTKEQAERFYSGLKEIEKTHGVPLEKRGTANTSILIFREPATNSLTIKPLNGIENSSLWKDVIRLFQDITANK